LRSLPECHVIGTSLGAFELAMSIAPKCHVVKASIQSFIHGPEGEVYAFFQEIKSSIRIFCLINCASRRFCMGRLNVAFCACSDRSIVMCSDSTYK
jgi:hypothetical protein